MKWGARLRNRAHVFVCVCVCAQVLTWLCWQSFPVAVYTHRRYLSVNSCSAVFFSCFN